MADADEKLILGSRSPRRLELLSLLVPRQRIDVRAPLDSSEAGFVGLRTETEIERRLAEIALRFCLSNPAASVVIPGMRSTRNVERNVHASSAGPLEENQLATLRRHLWVVDLYR